MADYGELLKGALVNEASDLGIWQGEGIIENLAKNGAVKYFGFTLNTATGAGSRLALTGAGAEDLSFCVYTSAGDLVGFAMDARSGVSLANLNSGDYIIKVSGSDTADFTVSHTITSAPSVSVDTADDFVVLFSGGYTASANRTYYYADIKKMYGLLTGVYGIAAENIYVLYADGTDPGIDNAAGESSDMSFAASSTVLAATENNLREVFSEISLAADGSDHFLFYSFDHGAESIDGSDYLCGWNEMISDRDFTAYADGITAGYQTWIMSQCYSWGMLEDITVSDTVFCAASSSGGKASHTAVSNVTGEVTAGFTASVAGGLESGLDSTHALFEYVLADNRYTELDNSTYAGGDFGIFGYGAAVENSTGSTGGDEDEKEIIAAKLQVLDESGAKELFEAAVNTTVAVSAKALALELGSAVRAVRFYLTGSDGVRRELEVDTESRDGWSFLWTIGKEFAPGEYTLSAVAEGSSGEYSEAVEVDFTVREENFHPEIISIALDHAAYCAQSTMTVTGKAFDLDRNGIDSVRVYLDADGDGVFPYPEEYLGLAAVGADGSWSYTFTLPETLEVGTYRIMAEAVDGFDMMVGASKALEFKVAERIVSEFQADSSRLVWLDLAAGACTVEITGKGTNGYLLIETDGSGVDLFNLNTACEVRARYSNGIWNTPVSVNESVVVNEVVPAPEKFVSVSNGALDLFFVTVAGVWGVEYEAKHVGNGVWSGTGETVDLAGKNRIRDIFEGSSDANVLVMTDDANGDALFADDIYSERPKGTEGARVENIKEVRAGAGDDIVDMTSSRYVGTGGVMTVFGGDGDDTIWSGNGSNTLFGDGGSDRIVGGAEADVIAGGAGDDTLHGGGGDDIFTFGRNWGRDTVTQLEGGTVTLWFAAGDSCYWNARNMTYSSNGNTVKVEGISADKVTLKFGSDDTELYTQLLNAGAFAPSATQKVYAPNETVYTNDNFADTTIAGGDEYVNYGEYASNVTVTDWGYLTISSGGSASDIILDHGNMYIRSGASATGIEITESGGNLYISGFASEITAHSGTIDVSHYDEDDPAIVSNVELQNAHLSVGEYGSASEVTIGQYASMWVSSGGYVSNAILALYGSLYISSGATAVETLINGGASMGIVEGAKVSKTTVNGSLFVSEGASANSVTVNSGGYIYIASGATVTKLDWKPFNGTVESAQGANVTYVALSGCYTGSGGKLVDNTTSVGGTVGQSWYSSPTDYDEVYVMSYGVASQTYIKEGGKVYISKGGSAQWNGIYSGGSLFIYEGGSAYGDQVNTGGYMYIASGGTATEICETGGYVEVAEGAVVEFSSCTLENIVVSGYNSMTVHANTVVNGVTVSGQYGTAVLDVFSGGVVNDMTLHSSGVVTIASGGTATNVTENGGYIYVADGATVEFVENTFGNSSLNCSATVHKNTVAENLDVVSSGYLYIYEGGAATGIKENGGFVYVADGATVDFVENSISGIFYDDVSLHSKTTANDITVSGATLHIFDGGVASNVKMRNDYQWLYDEHGNEIQIWFAGETVVYAGGSADQVSVNAGNRLYVSSGGKATQVTENGGYVELAEGAEVEFLANTLTGYISATSATLHENTRAENVTVIGDGALYVCSGGYAGNTVVSRGSSSYWQGDEWRDEYFSGLNLVVQNNGVAEKTTVERGGSMTVLSGGTATAIKENGGFVYVEDGAEVLFEKVVHSGWFTVDNMTVHSNTSVINAYISSGNLHICSGGYASNVSATRGAALHISSGGLLDKAEQFVDYDYDKQQYVAAGGIFVYEGGSANSVTLDAGEYMTVYSGGTATQLLENGGCVYTEDGAEVEFISNTLSYGYSGNMTVHSNTIMAGRLSSGSLHVYDGGIASGATISGGAMHVSSGGYAVEVTLSPESDYEQGRDTSALAVISSGGVAENTKMYGYTSMHILDGGVANSTYIYHGTLVVSSGGTANDTSAGGTLTTMTILEGAVANGIVFSNYAYDWLGGLLKISAGGIASNVSLDNTSASIEGRVDTAFINAAAMTVSSGGVAENITLSGGTRGHHFSSGSLYLANGAVANRVTIDSAGSMYIGNGGVANSVTVNHGGTVNMYQGTATAVKENGGWVDVNGTVDFAANTFENMTITKSATVHKNTIANDIVISGAGAKMVVFDGGMTSDVIVSGGSFYISSGGSADHASVRNGLLTVYTGGTATEIILDKGTLKVSSGGTATIAYNPWLTGEVTSAEESVVTYLDRDAGVYLGSAGYFVSKGDTFTDTNIGANSSALVYDGGTLNTATVESGGVIHISEGGIADNTTVNTLGALYISAGATATQITENGGFVEIAEGATATFAANTFKDLTYTNRSATVHANTIAENITLSSGGWLGIYNGGTANSTTVNSRGALHIYNGGIANSIMFNSEGSLYLSGGTANSFTVNHMAKVYVFNGGIANIATLNHSGALYISSGGVASSTTINDGGLLYISSGGVANNTIVDGSGVNKGGVLVIFDGGIANNTTISTGGHMNIMSGGTANSTIINHLGEMDVYDGGVANSTTMSGNSMRIFNGGVANSTTMSGGIMLISSGGVANSTTLCGGRVEVLQGGIANTAVISAGGMVVSSGGRVISALTVNATGSVGIYAGAEVAQIVENGGYVQVSDNTQVEFVSNTFSGVTLNLRQSMTVHSNTVAVGTVVNYGGCAYIYAGGTANNTTINSSGFVYVSNGATADEITVNENGFMVVYNGGSAHKVTVNYAGKTSVFSGGIVSSAVLYNAGSMFVEGGSASDLTVYAGGHAVVLNGGTIERISVNSFGLLKVSSGGVAKGVTILSSGDAQISAGGSLNSATVDYYGRLFVSSGAIATQIIENGGYVDIAEGAEATFAAHTFSDLIISGRYATVHANTVAENVTLSDNAYLYIFNSGTANSTTVKGYNANLVISSGGVANFTLLTGTSSSYNNISSARMYISNGGVANSTTISRYGYMYISSGGTANETIVNSGGQMFISSGGAAADVVVSSGARLEIFDGRVDDLFIHSGANLVFSNGTARNMEFAADVRYTMTNGRVEGLVANANAFLTTSGTEVFDLEIRTLGAVYMSGGVLSGAAVEDRGILQLCSGTYAADILVGSGGHCYLGDGSVVSGEFSIAEGATVLAFTGSILNFTVGDCSADKALVNDLCAISGNLDYTITLSTEQSSGLYRLADNVGESFKQEELMLFFGEDSIEGFNVGETLNAQGVTLELSLENNSLFLEVTNPNAPALSGIPDIDGGEFHNGNNGMLA